MDQRRPDQSPQRPQLPGEPQQSDGDDEAPRPGFPIPWVLLIVLTGILVWVLMQGNSAETGSLVTYSFLMEQVEAGNVQSVEFHGQVVNGKWKDPPLDPKDTTKQKKLEESFYLYITESQRLDGKLPDFFNDKGIVVSVQKQEDRSGQQALLWLLGPLMIILFFWFMMRRSADPMGSGMLGSFTKSTAKKFHADEKRTTFNDVAGMEQAKLELMEVVEFLKNPEKFQRLGATIPKGVLLMGPPGTGKTLMARATAGEAGVPFFSINGSEFIQMFVGVGASRVRDLFRTAREQSPCILFIDEIDAVGRIRGAGLGGGHDEREQTLNQILSEMDGFEQTTAVIVLAATNRPDVLDPALLRPGRFDRHVTIDRPNKAGRLGILKVHTRKVPLDADVHLEDIAAGSIGFSGADLKNLVNEAALIASRREATRVTKEDFELARDRVLMGPIREDTLDNREKRMTAYHEAGHALISWLLPELDPLHKVTIVPRGRALGVTQLLPNEDRYNVGEKKLHSLLAMLLGGRAAEKLIFDEFSAGAEDDLKKATGVARKMVAHWGMSHIIGPVAFRQADEHPFLGKEMHEQREFSEETARIIDEEVQRFLLEASQRATRMLEEHRDKLDTIAQALLDRESLDKHDVTALIGRSAQSASLESEKSIAAD